MEMICSTGHRSDLLTGWETPARTLGRGMWEKKDGQVRSFLCDANTNSYVDNNRSIPFYFIFNS